MATVRYLVHDVDAALPFYRALGFRLIDRWGPPFAIVKRKGLALWLSSPGTSAAKKLKDGSLPQPGGWNRLVIEVASLDDTMTRLEATGARFRSKPVKVLGGRHVLVEYPPGNPVELFEARAAEAQC